MSKTIKILGVCGSLRQQSFNKWSLLAAQKLVPANVKLDIYYLHDLPLYNQDHEANMPTAAKNFKTAIRNADCILFATPEYNYGLPGVLKNAVDWASRPYGDSAWKGKPCGIMSSSVGIFGGVRAQYALRNSFVFLEMNCLNSPEIMIGAAQSKFDKEGNLMDETTKKFIKDYLQRLVDLTQSSQLPKAKL